MNTTEYNLTYNTDTMKSAIQQEMTRIELASHQRTLSDDEWAFYREACKLKELDYRSIICLYNSIDNINATMKRENKKLGIHSYRCNHCGYTFNYSDEDVYSEQDGYVGVTYSGITMMKPRYQHYIDCPHCGTRMGGKTTEDRKQEVGFYIAMGILAVFPLIATFVCLAVI